MSLPHRCEACGMSPQVQGLRDVPFKKSQGRGERKRGQESRGKASCLLQTECYMIMCSLFLSPFYVRSPFGDGAFGSLVVRLSIAQGVIASH